MPKDSILKQIMTIVNLTALPFALSTTLAEARGAGAGFQTPKPDMGRVGRAYGTQPAIPPKMVAKMGDEIIAEHELIRVQASEAGTLFDDLRSQLAAQPDARLNIRWQLTRPASIK